MANNSVKKPVPESAPVPTLTLGSDECEVWLDVVTRSIEGYSSAAWTNDQKKICSMSPVVVAKCAVEVADRVLVEYRKRLCKGKDSQF